MTHGIPGWFVIFVGILSFYVGYVFGETNEFRKNLTEKWREFDKRIEHEEQQRVEAGTRTKTGA